MLYGENDTIFVENYNYKNINDLLNEILKKIEIFISCYTYDPIYLKLNVNQYYAIRAHNPNLIKFIKGDGAYILRMKVVF